MRQTGIETTPVVDMEFSSACDELAVACRILSHAGLAEDILGHVSVRLDDDQFLLRCRGPQERGLLFTTREDIHRTSIAGDDLLGNGYQVPNEVPIHREVLRARPDVRAIVHVHPPAVVAVDLAGLTLRPIVAAFNIPAMRMAHAGIPVYPRGLLINTTPLAREMVAALGEKPVCILRGHGIVTTGASVEEAVVRALNVDALARMTLQANQFGTRPPEIPTHDIAEVPDLGTHFNDHQVWLNRLARLEHDGFGL